MRQPDRYSATHLLSEPFGCHAEIEPGRWVPARNAAHNAWSWKWRFKASWLVLIGRADIIVWDEPEHFSKGIVERLWRLLPDKCEKCKGKRGGVRGNENVVGGVILCDYCSADDLK